MEVEKSWEATFEVLMDRVEGVDGFSTSKEDEKLITEVDGDDTAAIKGTGRLD